MEMVVERPGEPLVGARKEGREGFSFSGENRLIRGTKLSMESESGEGISVVGVDGMEEPGGGGTPQGLLVN